MDLPRVDAHTVEVAAAPERTWEALLGWASGSWSDSSARGARLLGCEQTAVEGRPGEIGSTVPGFRVAHAEPPTKLALEGRHRFSTYALDFEIADRSDGRSSLRAVTHAAFPGLHGQLYKTAVIRSRAHVLVTRRLLEGVKRRAERGTLDR